MFELFQMILRNMRTTARMENVEYEDLDVTSVTSKMDVEKFQDKTKPNINMDDKDGLEDVHNERMEDYTRDEVEEGDNSSSIVDKESTVGRVKKKGLEGARKEIRSDLHTDQFLEQLQAKKPKMMLVKSKQKNEIGLKEVIELKFKEEKEELELKFKQEMEIKFNQEKQEMEIKFKQEKQEMEIKFKQEKQEMELKVKQENRKLTNERNEKDDLRQKLTKEQKEKDDLHQKLTKERKENDDLCQKLHEELSCPVCFSIPRSGKIPMCRNGHIFCDKCISKE